MKRIFPFLAILCLTVLNCFGEAAEPAAATSSSTASIQTTSQKKISEEVNNWGDILDEMLSSPRNLIIFGLIALGGLLKRIPQVPNAMIVPILSVLSIVGSMILVKPWYNAFFMGIVWAAIAVYSYEMFFKWIGVIASRVLPAGLSVTRPPFPVNQPTDTDEKKP